MELQLLGLPAGADGGAGCPGANAILAGREPHDRRWLLLNASPDLRQQINSSPPFTRKTAFAIARVHAVLRENSVFNVLNLNLVQRLEEAPKGVKFGLEYIKREARTPGQQQGGIEALMFKADLLWA